MSDRLLLLSSLASRFLFFPTRRLLLELDAVELAAALLAVLQSLLNGVVSRLGLVVSIVDKGRSGAYFEKRSVFPPMPLIRVENTYPGRLRGSRKWGQRTARC